MEINNVEPDVLHFTSVYIGLKSTQDRYPLENPTSRVQIRT